jgi:hypothetical protein
VRGEFGRERIDFSRAAAAEARGVGERHRGEREASSCAGEGARPSCLRTATVLACLPPGA